MNPRDLLYLGFEEACARLGPGATRSALGHWARRGLVRAVGEPSATPARTYLLSYYAPDIEAMRAHLRAGGRPGTLRLTAHYPAEYAVVWDGSHSLARIVCGDCEWRAEETGPLGLRRVTEAYAEHVGAPGGAGSEVMHG